MENMLSKSNVLIVEDSIEQLDLINKHLKKCVGRTVNARNADEAISLLSEEKISLILLDHHLSGVSGLEFMEMLLQKNLLHIPVIIMVEPGKEPVAVNAMNKGAFSFVVKSGSYWLFLPGMIERAFEWSSKVDVAGKIRNGKVCIKDPVTDISTHHLFKTHLDIELKRAERYGRQFAILIVDIKDFKDINISYGRETGDKVLKIFANDLTKKMRGADMFCRHLGNGENFGGDEFLFLFESDQKGLQIVIQRIKDVLKGLSGQLGLSEKLDADIGYHIVRENAKESFQKAVEAFISSKSE